MHGSRSPAAVCSLHPAPWSGAARRREPRQRHRPGPVWAAPCTARFLSHTLSKEAVAFASLSHCESSRALPVLPAAAQGWRGDVSPAPASPAQPQASPDPTMGELLLMPLGARTQPMALGGPSQPAPRLHADGARCCGCAGTFPKHPHARAWALGTPVGLSPTLPGPDPGQGCAWSIPLPCPGCR